MKHVLQVVGKMNIGGAEQLLMNVYRNIDRTKLQFDFLTFYENGEKGFFDDEIKSLGGRIINIPKPNKLKFISNVENVINVLKSDKYDAIHTHIGTNCSYALVAAKKCGVPIRIAHSHNTPNPKRNIATKFLDPFLKCISNSNLTYCCACSEEAAKFRFTKRNRINNYTYMPNAVDFDAYLKIYDAVNIRKELGIPEFTKVILQVGNFKQQKNQLFSMDIAKGLKEKGIDFIMLFAGKDEFEYGANVKKKAEEYDLNDVVRFLGSRTDIPELMSAADIMIMPSIYEGLGIVLLEAQASGLTCIVSEAIQPEADMNMGIFKTCSLNDKKSWINTIVASFNEKKPEIESRKAAIENSAFRLENTVKEFKKLYGIAE